MNKSGIKMFRLMAVEKYGYTQKEIADHLGLHFASISHIMRIRATMLKI